MPETEAFKPKADSNLDIEEIIGAPLVAAVRANAMMLREQTKFLMDFCFSKDKDGDIYHPIMIEMAMTRGELVPGEGPGENAGMVSNTIGERIFEGNKDHWIERRKPPHAV